MRYNRLQILKSALYKTQSGEPNYVDHKFFFNVSLCQELPAQKIGDSHQNTIELASWLVHLLCDFKATCHQEASVSLEYSMKIHFTDVFYLFSKSSPSMFLLQFRNIYFCYIFRKIKIDSNISSSTYPTRKNVLFPLLDIYVLLRNQEYLQKIQT